LNLIYLWFANPGVPPVAIETKPPVAVEEKAPVLGKANDAGPQSNEVSGKPGLTPNCEKELRRTADLLRFFANRIQTGEETQSVVADVIQQEKRIAAVCE
jgi:hypothetical protein